MLTSEVGPGRKKAHTSLESVCVDSHLRWETPDAMMTIKLPERSEFGSGAIRVASPLCSTAQGRSIMATDLESLGKCGACVRMIIYWERAADPYIYSHLPFIPAEDSGCLLQFCGIWWDVT